MRRALLSGTGINGGIFDVREKRFHLGTLQYCLQP